ncbi:protein phosphatase 2C domain-containing protein [Lentzea xinjiangensis]|uniref:protein phosphatase 2C domain-containing protein n=1 Tax=Lentzea xinjiangensis TaxID=402600 RepID=UPI0015A5E70A|nr:protein phosphatase 2C domain-containing protein [Lentzea xinjiangensis]
MIEGSAVRTQMATEAGRTTVPSQDRALVGPNLLAVLDGVTAEPETGCGHGVGWFADQLAAELLRCAHLDPAPALAQAITQTRELHSGGCDLGHPDSPSAAVGLVQVKDDVLRYLVLGDVTVVIDTKRELHVVSDTRTKRTAGADPADVEHALVGVIPLQEVRRVAILSDGAARAVDLFRLFDWPKALELMAANGPDDLIRRMRAVEKEDAKAVEWPREKVSDDATVVYLDR